MDADSGEGESREELEEYLAKIFAELKAREARVLGLDTEIAKLETVINEGLKRPFGRTDSAALASHQAYLKTLRQKLEVLRGEQREAAAEVAKARERREMIEEELRRAEQAAAREGDEG
jgi:hypothetical protein